MKPAVKVVGAGPAGLMAAQVLAEGGFPVTMIDHMPSPARKFLLAGRGGLNLTHSEPMDVFLGRYGDAREFLEPTIRSFTPQDVVAWAESLGVETFVGSSGRIFPKSMKASPLLRAWLRKLERLGVQLQSRTDWAGPNDQPTVLAMGGASWPHLGSNAAWVAPLRNAGIEVKSFTPSNSRVRVEWSEHLKSRFAGAPLKNIALRYGDAKSRGELVISRDGIEGGAIYQLSRAMRERSGETLFIDLKPDLNVDQVAKRLASPKAKMSRSNFLRKALGLSPVAISLINEVAGPLEVSSIKSLPLKVEGHIGIDWAISSAGGIVLSEVDQNFRLKKLPMTYAVGEMLDWDAPTGGYLLQACFSTAVAAARDIAEKLA